jgi:NAD-dependent dihydropyrimidine dehydrogenase PreA subunit
MKYIKNAPTITLYEDKCTGCWKCLEVCPRNVFEKNGDKIIIADRDSCMECSACVLNCPFEALSVRKGVGCAAAVLRSMITGGEPSCGCD